MNGWFTGLRRVGVEKLPALDLNLSVKILEIISFMCCAFLLPAKGVTSMSYASRKMACPAVQDASPARVRIPGSCRRFGDPVEVRNDLTM
jgi:hypothetical protein